MPADLWNERYRQGEHSRDQPLDFIARLLPPGDGRLALDLACGAGRHALLMASKGWRVTAVDWSETALALIRAQDSRIETVAADLEAGAFSIERNRWDLICVSFYMQRELFPAIGNGLRPGGILAMAFPMLDHREGVRPMRTEFLIDSGELRAIYQGFNILHDVETLPDPPRRRTAEFWATSALADNTK